MKIAIDALGITRPGGGRSATLNLLEPLLSIDEENEYFVFLDKREPTLVSVRGNLRQIISPTTNRIQTRIWAQTTWPKFLKREKIAVIHHTKNLTTHLSPCPSIVTIHDLTILEHPEIYPTLDVLYWRTFEKLALRKASHIIAVSQLTANDLKRFYAMEDDKITVIPEGIDEAFVPVPAPIVQNVRTHYKLPKHYILHVGSISAKKNLATLARAYFKLIKERNYAGALVLVGRRYWKEGDPELDTIIEENRGVGHVILTGPVPQNDLPALYTGADCFCFVSVHEGFGLVPLEAAACGTPVISSRVGVIEQLLGNAAIYVSNPYDSVELAQHIQTLIDDPLERKKRSECGLNIAPRFSRRRAAEITLNLYERTTEI